MSESTTKTIEVLRTTVLTLIISFIVNFIIFYLLSITGIFNPNFSWKTIFGDKND